MNVFNFSQFLVEAKSIGMIYHFTSLYNLSKIAITDTLRANRETEEIKHIDGIPYYGDKRRSKTHYYISFTRNKLMNKHADMIDNPTTCRLDFDGNALSNHYKITPINFFQSGNKHKTNYYDTVHQDPDTHMYKQVHTKYTSKDESEEALISSSDVLKNISSYIVSIQLPSFEQYKYEFKQITSSDEREGFIYDIKDVLEDYIEPRVDEGSYSVVNDDIDEDEEEEETEYMETEDVLHEMCNEQSFTDKQIMLVYQHLIKEINKEYSELLTQ